ncbi:MAG: peptide chain release factor 2 [candidate division WS6 bacterium 34_10]|jgi:peptide chain release factor 2|uniref:Peptide chain release factor 2 n=1 Tax=candidate division WS6 bacterium 34_10 TaxID=1641389 RepID=A0A124FWX9_9BACT|nr:MAG: peptide chain release factor 2 [candidate division WS6 bacterium 34_10]
MEVLTKKELENDKELLDSIIHALDLDKKKEIVKELEKESLKEDFWNDTQRAQRVMKRLENLKSEIETAQELTDDLTSLTELYGSAENSEELLEDHADIHRRIKEFEKLKFLSGKYDDHDALLSIHAGQGGTESNDWSEMLLRMYQMYCDRKGWKYKVEEVESGSETGITHATMRISGDYVYGMLKKEHGTHRLVRISPYNAQGLRQTTFAGVEVVPVIEKVEKDIEIPESDIEFKAVRSGGPGGQSVNKTSSAVQITHIPTGITVHSSTHRSQAQNRENALSILKSKLARILEDERIEEIDKIKGDYKKASWGNQIRNYVLHPYKLVKDLRTNVESNDPESVLDGELDEFIEAQLRIQ